MTDLAPGRQVALSIEKPAAGGRMIARADGRIVLVSGVIPGEEVTARVERVGKGVAYAEAVAVRVASADRVEPPADPACGGCLYAHIAYSRQLEIKAQVIADALERIGRIAWPVPIPARSRADGYRMRARLHLRDGRAGFFREGTHDLCDPRATRQLLPETVDAVDRVLDGLRCQGVNVQGEIEVAENVDGSARVAHLELGPHVDLGRSSTLGNIAGLTGVTSRGPAPDFRTVTVSGDPHVTDALTVGGRTVSLRRHVLAFFQANRYLLQDLVAHVVGMVPEGSRVIDLYAGVGLFAVSAAVARNARVTAVEGDRIAGLDLSENSRAADGRVTSIRQPVEVFTRSRAARPEAVDGLDLVIIDPPRTGMSREALEGAIGLKAPTVVYVSCDVATLARDARRLVDGGYAIRRLDAFDLFPNTPHVETVVLFERAS